MQIHPEIRILRDPGEKGSALKMGIFYSNLNGMGPEGPVDRTEKRGPARFCEIVGRDAWGLIASGFLAVLSAIPYAAGMFVSLESHALLPMLLTCPLGGMLAAPQICGVADTILRSLRDEPSFWGRTYRRAWKQNAKGCLLPGAVGGLLFGLQHITLFSLNFSSVNLFLLASMLLGLAVSVAIFSWALPQLALMDLPPFRVLLNSILLCVRYPVRTLCAVLVTLAYWGFLLASFPMSLVLFLFVSFWFPLLIVLMILYGALDETFHVEESLEARDPEETA